MLTLESQIRSLRRTFTSHLVEYVTRKVKDRFILEDAYVKQALLITHDRDFERLVFSEHRPT